MRRLYHRIAYIILISFAVISSLSCVSVSSDSPAAIDYSDRDNWAYYAEGEGKADLFLVCPTVDMGSNGNTNMSLEDDGLKASFIGALNMERGIYEDSTLMYAPFYRQMTFPLYYWSEEDSWPYLAAAYEDVEDAFLYYIENLNDGRPFILAGFSQGAQLVLMLMENLFDNPSLSSKLVAAYCIGWRITDEDIGRFPHLRMAEGEDDTGVIISFNSESEDAPPSFIVPEGVKTLGINPLSWTSDSTFADKALNKGACFTDYSGAVVEEIPHLTGCYLDSSRGTLKLPDISPEEYSSSLFPDGVYHLYDYQFFFRNLQENVGKRVDAWFKQQR